jgi:protein SCO1/2
MTVIAYYQFAAPAGLHGSSIEPPQPVADFTLQSADGPVSLSDFRGKFVLLYFGYTYCPDVCPATLSTLDKALARAGDVADKFQVVFISVDPNRDNPKRLAEYARFFNPAFIGITGSREEIDRVTQTFGIYYRLNDDKSKEDYTVDHTSRIIVIDPEGNMRLLWSHEVSDIDIAADLKTLTKR